jgi:hypothetical protein
MFGWTLRPGGYLVLIWNNRDERVPWVAALEQLIITPLYPPDVPRQQTGAWRSVFENQAFFATPPVTLSAEFSQPGGHTVIADRILSLRFVLARAVSCALSNHIRPSVVNCLPVPEQEVVRAFVLTWLAASTPHDVAPADLHLPHTTDCFVYRAV